MRQDQEGESGGECGKRRRNWISGAREVVRATEGKGVVITSGAIRAEEMRGSQDLINLLSFPTFFLTCLRYRDSCRQNCCRSDVR